MTKHSIARFGVGGLGKLKWALEWNNGRETIQARDIKFPVRTAMVKHISMTHNNSMD